MAINWFYLVIIYILANSASKILQKYALREEEVDPTAFSAFWHLVVGFVAIPSIFFEEIKYPVELSMWALPLLSGIFFTICMLMYFHALKNTEVSQVETIGTTRAIWVMILGIAFFGEALSWSKILGVTLIFMGLLTIYWRKSENQGFGKYHAFVFLYAFLNSSAYAVDKYALSYFSVSFYNALLYFLPGVFTILVFPGTIQKMKLLMKPKKNNLFIVMSCLVQAVSTLALYTAYKYGELSVVGPVSQTTTVITVMIGIVFLKERWNLRKKLAGVLLTLVGIVFLKVLTF